MRGSVMPQWSIGLPGAMLEGADPDLGRELVEHRAEVGQQLVHRAVEGGDGQPVRAVDLVEEGGQVSELAAPQLGRRQVRAERVGDVAAGVAGIEGPLEHVGPEVDGGRGGLDGRGQQPDGRLLEPAHLGGQIRVVLQELVQLVSFVGLERVEGVGAEQGASQLVAAQLHGATPCSAVVSLAMPRRILDFAVPSGMPSNAATSRKVRPPK